MSEYGDYGKLGGRSGASASPFPRQTQVYLATHTEDGLRMDYMYRSFISFTFGGKNIEDFNLIATTSGDRLERDGYASFDDITSSYDNLPGQFYWNTHYKTNSMTFNLATDGIDLKLLDEFLHWFQAGVTRELILAEHPNRGILARVSEPPQLHLLPFESHTTIKIAAHDYSTKTTLYKGEITLTLIMDEPFWYSLDNVLGQKVNINNRDIYLDIWVGPNGGEPINIFASLDALKILYEDGIPLGSMIQTNMLLGNGAYANVEDNIMSKIWDPNASLSVSNIGNLSGGGACINGIVNGIEYYGTIAGSIVDASDNGITTLSPANSSGNPCGYFYYSGTAPAPTIIKFTMAPQFDSNNEYIISPKNSHLSLGNLYNTITIEGETVLELKFTTPNIYTSYNKVIDIIKWGATNSVDLITLAQHIRDEVRHEDVRKWAIQQVIGSISNLISTMNDSMKTTMINQMKLFIGKNNSIYPVTFTFNSETGLAIGMIERGINLQASGTKEEDVGDMLRSNYIFIRDRNIPNDLGYITGWTVANKRTSHRIYHDISGGITNFSIIYKNMYL